MNGIGSARYGASPSTWQHFAKMGLTADLSPVVANPEPAISPRSKLRAKDKGKVPSDYNQQREIRGIPEWQKKQATSRDIAKWMLERDYGICIKTRSVRAIDVDIDDPNKAADIRALIEKYFGSLPIRGRADSSRFLAAITLPGAYKKRAVVIGDGKVEFLASGQQFIADSTHPSGARYHWGKKLPDAFPMVEPAAFEAFWAELHSQYTTTQKKVTPDITKASSALRSPSAPPSPSGASLAELQAILDRIKIADLKEPYDDWLRVGMALHFETAGNLHALSMWDRWSVGARAYVDLEDLSGRWEGFQVDRDNPCRIGTLLHLAGPEDFSAEYRKILESPDAAIVARHLCTDLRNAERIRATFGAHIMVVAGRCFHWSGTHWQHDEAKVYRCVSLLSVIVAGEAAEWRKKVGASVEETQKYQAIAEALSKWGKRCEMQHTMDAALGLLRKLLDVPVKDLDADVWALNCLNGTVDLRTSAIRVHDPLDRITRCLDVAFRPGATAVRFELFLTEIMPGGGAVIGFMRRWYGYASTGSVREQKFLLKVGVGSNGKGVLTAAIDATLGPYAIPAPPNLLTGTKGADRHPTEIADLLGCRLVTSSETDDGAMLREGFVKLITGGDRLKARYMRRDFFEFTPTFKLQLLTNHLPQIRGTDFAIWRRTLVVRFPVRFGTAADVRDGRADQIRDDDLQCRLVHEREGILAWIIAGAAEWYRDGLRPPGSVLEAVKRYQSEQDRVSLFVEEECIVGSGERAPITALFETYVVWSKAAGFTPLGRNGFLDEIIRVVPNATRTEITTGPSDRRRKHRYIQGIGLTDGFNERA